MVFRKAYKNNGRMTITNYMLIGVIVGFLMEYTVNKVTDQSFGFFERLFVVLLWPISVLTFIIGFFKR